MTTRATAGVRFGAALASLDDAAARIAGAVRAIDDVRGHPGVLRARADSVGDDDLAVAVVDLAAAWDWGLQELRGDADRWAVLLAAVARSYRDLEHTLVPDLPRTPAALPRAGLAP